MAWRPAAVVAGLVILVAGWWLNMPAAQTQALGAHPRVWSAGRSGAAACDGRTRTGGRSDAFGNRIARKRQLAGSFARRGAAVDGFGERARLGQRALCRCRYGPDDHYECVCAINSCCISGEFVLIGRFGGGRADAQPKIDLPKDSPVTLLSEDWGDSRRHGARRSLSCSISTRPFRCATPASGASAA